MKKKVLVLLMASVLTTSCLVGCGSSEAETDAYSVSSVLSETETEMESEKEMSNDFNPLYNQHETILNVEFEVPSSWTKKETDDYLYYYPSDGMLMIYLSEGAGDVTDIDNQNTFIKAISDGMDDFAELDRYVDEVFDGVSSLVISFTGEVSDHYLSGYITVFSMDNMLYFFMYSDYSTSEYDRSDDYFKIIDSLSYIETESIDTVEESVEASAEAESSAESEISTSENTESQEEITTGMYNALKSAKNYLSVMAFSYSGLINQLEYEGYSTEEATYAVDNCGADWNEQAAEKAQEYLNVMSFSRSGLIDQLEYDGFTSEQAEYGVSAVGY